MKFSKLDGNEVTAGHAGQGHFGADIHRIPHETIPPTYHEFSWRIERRGRAFPDEHKHQHAPKRNRRPDRYHDRASNLRRSNNCGSDNARPGQESARILSGTTTTTPIRNPRSMEAAYSDASRVSCRRPPHGPGEAKMRFTKSNPQDPDLRQAFAH